MVLRRLSKESCWRFFASLLSQDQQREKLHHAKSALVSGSISGWSDPMRFHHLGWIYFAANTSARNACTSSIRSFP